MVESHHEGLPLGGYEEQRRKLNEERRKEFNEMLKQKVQYKGNAGSRESSNTSFYEEIPEKKQAQESHCKTYITSNTIPNPCSYVDEAYNFYASHNPLDPDLNEEASYVLGHTPRQNTFTSGLLSHINSIPIHNQSVAGCGCAQVPAQLASVDARQGRGHDNEDDICKLSQVQTDKDYDIYKHNLLQTDKDYESVSGIHLRHGRPQEVAAIGIELMSQEERRQNHRQQQMIYKEELEKQMLEQKIKRNFDKEAEEKSCFKLDDVNKFDPLGKDEGGSPLRDQFSNSFANLPQVKYNKSQDRSCDGDSLNDADTSSNGDYVITCKDGLTAPSSVQTKIEGSESFAHGGHGIFSYPKTDAEKMHARKYMLDLRRQMEEKRNEEKRKKQQQKLDEEREQKTLETQWAQMKEEYEDEQKRMKEKAEEAKRKNEELMQLAEERRKARERKKQSEKQKEQAEEQMEREREIRERQKEEEARNRGQSPVIPTLRGKFAGSGENRKMITSPLIPAVEMKFSREPLVDITFKADITPGENSAEILIQLAEIRAKLHSEQRRVQRMMADHVDDDEFIDLRAFPRTPAASALSPESDVCETSMNLAVRNIRRRTVDRSYSHNVGTYRTNWQDAHDMYDVDEDISD